MNDTINAVINTMKNPRFIVAFVIAVVVMTGLQVAFDDGSTTNSSAPEIALVLPEGHCMLDETQAADRRLMEIYRTGNKGLNHVLGGSADCQQLARWRTDGNYYLENTALFLAALAPPAGPAGTSRPIFLEVMAKELGAIGDMASLADEVEQRAEGANDGIDVQNTTGLGVLDTDDVAVYFGLVQHMIADDGKTPKTVAGVLGSTLIDGEAITFGLYAPYKGRQTIEALLAEHKTNMHNLVEANGG